MFQHWRQLSTAVLQNPLFWCFLSVSFSLFDYTQKWLICKYFHILKQGIQHAFLEKRSILNPSRKDKQKEPMSDLCNCCFNKGEENATGGERILPIISDTE